MQVTDCTKNMASTLIGKKDLIVKMEWLLVNNNQILGHVVRKNASFSFLFFNIISILPEQKKKIISHWHSEALTD